jgi:hypothetical protein
VPLPTGRDDPIARAKADNADAVECVAGRSLSALKVSCALWLQQFRFCILEQALPRKSAGGDGMYLAARRHSFSFASKLTLKHAPRISEILRRSGLSVIRAPQRPPVCVCVCVCVCVSASALEPGNLRRLAGTREHVRNDHRLCHGSRMTWLSLLREIPAGPASKLNIHTRPKMCAHSLQYQLGLCRHVKYGRPVGARPVGARPVGARPVGARPVGARPVGARPVGARPVGARPARTKSGRRCCPTTATVECDRP